MLKLNQVRILVLLCSKRLLFEYSFTTKLANFSKHKKQT
jgi:hypothetical protein